MHPFNPVNYLNSLNPAEFDRYKAGTMKPLPIPKIRRLECFVKQLPIDKNMLVYLWRFCYGMDHKIIRKYLNLWHAKGIAEAFRFTCRRYLDCPHDIADASISRALECVMRHCDIIFSTPNGAIRWIYDAPVDDMDDLEDAEEYIVNSL
jgi:hypothetical protein